MWAFIKRLFKGKNEIKVDVGAPTIPQAFGYPEKEYSILVKELTEIIQPNERLASFSEYLKNPNFEKLHLDLQNPQHAAVLGYAFCAAVMIQRNVQQEDIANKVLEVFYPETVRGKKIN